MLSHLNSCGAAPFYFVPFIPKSANFKFCVAYGSLCWLRRGLCRTYAGGFLAHFIFDTGFKSQDPSHIEVYLELFR